MVPLLAEIAAETDNPWRVAAFAEGSVIVALAGYIAYLHAARVKDLLATVPVLTSCRDVLARVLGLLE